LVRQEQRLVYQQHLQQEHHLRLVRLHLWKQLYLLLCDRYGL
jgi:hypothetical protein